LMVAVQADSGSLSVEIGNRNREAPMAVSKAGYWELRHWR
jgi:hypothetical protein